MQTKKIQILSEKLNTIIMKYLTLMGYYFKGKSESESNI
tara:strand:+ start:5029 stop:5145 length:117 start_codon:yes stop_codon:yes gene_type:complete